MRHRHGAGGPRQAGRPAHPPAALLISGAFDPQTPPSWAEAAVKRLANGTSYVFPAHGHGVLYSGESCAGRIAQRFLDDPSRRPDDECFADLPPLVFAPPPPR